MNMSQPSGGGLVCLGDIFMYPVEAKLQRHLDEAIGTKPGLLHVPFATRQLHVDQVIVCSLATQPHKQACS